MFRINLNGLSGTPLKQLLASNWDVGVLRPYVDDSGECCCTVNVNGKPTVVRVNNDNAALPHEAWKMIDTAVMRAARPRLKFVADLRAAGLTRNIANAMGKTSLLLQRMTDPGSAVVGMDPVEDGETNDRPEFDEVIVPLPIIHSDFSYSARELEISRYGDVSLDVTKAEASARRVAEEAEKLALGLSTYNAYKHGGGTIYGLVNYTSALTKTITSPAATAWTPEDTVDEVLEMIQQSIDANHYGPWMLYFSKAWTKYLSMDYVAANAGTTSTITLRERLLKCEGVSGVSTLDYLTGYYCALVEMNSDVVQEAVGFDPITVQWQEKGGLKLCFKVMAMLVPLFKADIAGNTGIVIGSV